VEVKNYFQLFMDEAMNPFYMFQVFSIGLWSADEYYYYGGAVIVMSLYGILMTLSETRRQSKTLQQMAMAGGETIVSIRLPSGG